MPFFIPYGNRFSSQTACCLITVRASGRSPQNRECTHNQAADCLLYEAGGASAHPDMAGT